MTKYLLVSSIVISTGTLTWLFLSESLWQFALGIALAGLLWLISIWRRWHWFANLGLGVIAAGCVIGSLNNLPALWLLLGLILGLAAWDLNALQTRLDLAAEEDRLSRLEQRHLLSLGAFLILAGIISILATNIRLRLSFTQAVVLLVTGFTGLMQLIRWFKRNPQP